MNEKIIHTISLKADEVLTINKKPKIKQPNYYKVGNGTMNKHKVQSINLIKETIHCSKPAQTLIEWIIDGMVYDPKVEGITFVVKVIPETSASKQTLKKGYKELFEKDLVRRVKRSHYIINPNAIQTDYEKQILIWNTCSSFSI